MATGFEASNHMFQNLSRSSTLLEFLLHDEEDKYMTFMLEEGFKHLIFQCAMSVLHVLFVIPSNIFTLIAIAKTKSLWTLSNAILAINGVSMALGSALMLFLRQSHFPLLLYNEQRRPLAYTISWWVTFLIFRIGNFRYILVILL